MTTSADFPNLELLPASIITQLESTGRALLSLNFCEETLADQLRQHAYLRGQYDMLHQLLAELSSSEPSDD